MTNFLYEMQDELFNLNMILPVGEFSPIKKLMDHIENQGKQLRELNKAIAKKNETIAKCENEMNNQRMYVRNLVEKVRELNDGILDSEDLSWKQKYDLAIKEKECAVNALQNKCKFLENQIAKIEENFKKLERKRNEFITRVNELRAENKKLERTNAEYIRINAALRGKLVSIGGLTSEINDVLTLKE